MNKILLTIALVFCMLAAGTQAFAQGDAITFDESGLGIVGVDDVFTFNTLDWAVGNALSIDSVDPIGSPVGTENTFQTYFQTQLNAFQDENGLGIGGTGLNSDYFITLQVAFLETSTIEDTFPGSVSFEFAAGGVNFFDIRATTVAPNVLAGTGFDTGTSIMSGFVNEVTGGFQVVEDTDPPIDPSGVEIDNLDNFLANNYPGVQTVVGNGAQNVEGEIDTVDQSVFTDAFFDDLGTSIILELFTNTSTIIPFDQTNPAATVAGLTPDVFSAGGINGFPDGISDDFLFQADANTSFAVIPEPATIILSGLGLLGFGIRSRRRKK
jgi:hypothetical protein